MAMTPRSRTEQLALYGSEFEKIRTARSSTFADNMSLGIHRWFRYSAGYSAEWVSTIIRQELADGKKKLLDPFAGSGTTILEAQRLCLDSIGIEAHPFIFRVGATKLLWHSDVSEYIRAATKVLETAVRSSEEVSTSSDLMHRIYTPQALEDLLRLRTSLEMCDLLDPFRSLVWLTLCSILRECSTAGTAQWQYILPNKPKRKAANPYNAFSRRIQLFAADMRDRQTQASCDVDCQLLQDDARTCSLVDDDTIDLVLTSPPYANNYDYADATRVEMTFFGEIENYGDLHDAVRRHLLRSCSQHAARENASVYEIVSQPKLDAVRDEILNCCVKLAEVRLSKGGKKQYHMMIASYFSDMTDVLVALRRVVKPGGRMCLVVGDSAPYGVHVAVDRLLGEIACQAGFKSYVFEKTRDRNVKWKNRKHTVPLHEGRLWIEA